MEKKIHEPLKPSYIAIDNSYDGLNFGPGNIKKPFIGAKKSILNPEKLKSLAANNVEKH